MEISDKKPLRVLILDTGKEWGGGTSNLIEIFNRVDRNRFDITALFYTNYPKGSTSNLKTELASINIPLKILPTQKQPLWAKLLKELARGFFCFSATLRTKTIFRIDMIWRILPRAREITEIIRQDNFELLYLNNQPSSNLEGYLAAEMTGIAALQHCQIEVSLNAEEIRIVNRAARKIICVSKGVMDCLIKQGIRPDLCSVVYNAIDDKQVLPISAVLPQVADNKLIIGSVGSLIKRKANSHLLQAVVRLKKSSAIPFHVVLVGEGPDRAALTALVNELGLHDDVTFAGFQNNPMSWIAAMDIMVLASAREGFSLVTLEAMFLGKPVIISDIVGPNELVTNNLNGLLFPYGDIEKLAASLKMLIESDSLRKQYGAAGRQIALEKFTMQKLIDNIESVIEETMQ